MAARGCSLTAYVLMMLALVGCATTPPLKTSDRAFPPGTVIALNNPVTIPAGRVSATLRGGSIGNVYSYDATCRLEVDTIRKTPFTVAADAFTVTGVYRDTDTLTGSPFPFPSIGNSFNSFGDGPGLIYFNTYIYVQSAYQPDVSRLKCWQLKESDVDPFHLSYEDIRTVLGDTVTISRPGGAPDSDLRFKQGEGGGS